MAGESADLDNDTLELLLDEEQGAYDNLAIEGTANGQSAHSIVRHSAARKYNQEDPIEAASAEMILQKNTA